MIKFILVQVSHQTDLSVSCETCQNRSLIYMLSHNQNRQGKTRLSKWYAPYDDDEKVRRDNMLLSVSDIIDLHVLPLF